MDKNTKSLEDIFVLTGKYTLLEDFLKLPEGKTVEMDLGCGKGGFTIAMAQTYPDRVVIAADITNSANGFSPSRKRGTHVHAIFRRS